MGGLSAELEIDVSTSPDEARMPLMLGLSKVAHATFFQLFFHLIP